MPLTRKHFELGIDISIEEWMKKTHAFVTQHKEQAFTQDELAEALLPKPRSETQLFDFQFALDKLVELGAVERRTIKGRAFFSYGHERLDRVLR